MNTITCKTCKLDLDIQKFEKRKDTGKYRNQCKLCRSNYVSKYKLDLKDGKRHKKTVIIENNMKQCSKCQLNKILDEFPKRKSKHGYRHECKLCKKQILQTYYQTTYNDVRRKRNKDDINMRLIRAQRNYIYKCLTRFKNKKQGSLQYLHCTLDILKSWIEFQFDDEMSWENYGKLWTIDHVLPLSQFNLFDETEQYIAFDWKNLQPSKTNFTKSNKILFNEYLKVYINAHKFIKQHQIGPDGYQGVSQSLHWLRKKLGYGKNPSDNYRQSASKSLQHEVNGTETIWFWVFL